MEFIKKSNLENDFHLQLEKLIHLMKNTGFLNDPNVEKAFKNAPRHNFVSNSQKDIAYENIPIPIMEGQTISQPIVVARMTEWLDLKEGHKVLEIGCGSGWQSAILSNLVGCGKIYTIERHKKLVNFAKRNLDKLGIKNVKIIHGDGNEGILEYAPFDRILVAAACKIIPPKLLEQLALGGLLIAPVGDNVQSLILLKKTDKGFKEVKKQEGYSFVPLI